ncbi:MAG: lipopolysaccharide biosynthesis protein [Nitrosarchaeum sp.]
MDSRFRDLTSLGIASVVTSAIGGVFWFFMASSLGTEKYGEVSYLISIGVITSTISLSGSANTLIVYLAKGEKIQSTVFFIAIIASLISAAALFLFININIEISIYVIGSVIFTLAISDLLGRKLYAEYSKYMITQKILLVGLALSMYYTIGFQGIILGIALSFFPYSFLLYKEFRKAKLDFSIIKTRSGFMVNSYVLDLTNAFNGSLDKILIAPIMGFALLGNYQLGVQFMAVLSIIPGIIYNYTLPHDSSGNPNVFLKKLTIIGSVVLAVLSVVLAPVVLPTLFPTYNESVQVIQIMSVSIIPATIVSMLVSKFLGSGNSKIVLIGSGVYLGSQIPTILLLGMMFGVNGAASSIVIANGIQAIYFILINRSQPRKQST